MPHVFVIAEAGISHDGDLDRALALIECARAAGADAVKFQTFNAQRLAAKRQNADLFLRLKPYQMPLSWLPKLKERCDSVGIEFMTTCFDEKIMHIVAPFVRRFKIGHAEGLDQEFIDAHKEYGKPIIVSRLNTSEDMSDALEPEDGYPHRLQYLYCTPDYPTKVEALNLRVLPFYHGFSDHTREEMIGAFAVAGGAEIVEVHFRDWDTDKDNLDWPVSHDPSALIRYVEHIRQAQLALYGAASEETKKLERPESAPRISHPPASGECAPSDDRPAAAS